MANTFIPSRYHKLVDTVQPDYDDIVDRTDFKRGQDKERNMRLAGDTSGSTTQCVYDFPDGKVTDDNQPSDIQLALRSGRLDKADVDTIKRGVDIQAKDEFDENQKKKLDKQQKAIDSARQSYLDSQTGFDSSKVATE